MSSKNLKILSIIFVILLTIAAYPVFKQEVQNVIKPKPENVSLFSEQIELDEVSSIDLKSKTGNIELRRHSDGWKIQNKKADLARISQFITSFNNMTVGDIVSINSENHSSLGVDSEKGYEVIINSKNKDYSVVVGNVASPGTFYVRKSDEAQVHVAKSELKNLISLVESEWRDKIVVNLGENVFDKIMYEGAETFSLEKDAEIWNYVQYGVKEELSDEDSTKFVNLFSPLLAYNFASEEEVELFDKTALWRKIRINVYSENSLILNLVVFEPSDDDDEDTFLVKNVTEDSDIYKVYDFRFEGLFEYLDK